VIAFCKVQIDSPLPQLSREFDYIIPEGMLLEVGQVVSVPFGRQQQPKTAVVTKLVDSSEFATAEVLQVLGPKIMTSGFISYLQTVAKRQAISPGELLRLAITTRPKRKADFTQENSSIPEWVLQDLGGKTELDSHTAEIVSSTQRLISGSVQPEWALTALQSALSAGGGVIINLPDHRHIRRFRSLARLYEIEDQILWVDEYKTPSKRFWVQQRLLKDGGILVGSRSVMFFDVKDLQRIIVVNDLDPSHESESSPYLATRELAFIRGDTQQASVHVISHIPSAEVIRLSELGYLKMIHDNRSPRVSFGLESQISTNKLIDAAIKVGPVLIVTGFAGDSAAIYCKSCRHSGNCIRCGGSIYMPTNESYRCRTCSSAARPRCVFCGSSEFLRGAKGAARTAADFGKIIPGVRVIESSQSKPVSSITGKVLVVATAGAIPESENGYELSVIDQAQVFLSRESLRALEHSLRIWTDAASHLSTSGQLHFANFDGEVVRKFSIGQQLQLLQAESAQRKQLGLSPWRRLGIVEGDTERLNRLADTLSSHAEIISTKPKLVFSYQYKDGAQVSDALVQEQLSTPPREGTRRKRGLKIVMDGQGLV